MYGLGILCGISKGTFKKTTRNILPIQWKIDFLYNVEILRVLRLRSNTQQPTQISDSSYWVSIDGFV